MASTVVTARQHQPADPEPTAISSATIAPSSSSRPPSSSTHQRSFSSVPPPNPVTAGRSNSFDASGRDLTMSQPSVQPLSQPLSQPQSQPSSQQSFAMSQPPSQSQFSRHQLPDHPRRNGQATAGIYSAVYSGVNVYEMEVNDVIVMRRRHDGWLNATQILKVARIDKGKRTKILEKEIQTGEHEKVQGGYGKYQGTWICFERGVEVCKQYHVEELLRPLLTYDMSQEGGLNTPTKEQAMALHRKRMYSAGIDRPNSGLSGTFFKNISSTASNAVAAINKARFDSPGPRGRNGPTRPPSFSRQPSIQNMDDFPGNSQQSFTSDYGQNMDMAYSTQNTQLSTGDEPPRKRQRIVTPAESFGYPSQSMEVYANNYPGSPTEPNESFVYTAEAHVQDPDANFLPPLPFEASPEAERKRSLLMSLFMDKGTNETDHVPVETLQSLSPVDLDAPIDASSNTALHWAATLARTSLLRTLIAAGANPCRVNASGETALMRASAVTNNSEQVSFPELLDALGNTIDIRDKRGRTVLHHIALSSAVKGRSHSSRYYLESLLEWVVRHGSAPSSQTTVINGGAAGAPNMGIGRFMSEIVNAQDKSGDTALGIASRVGNRSIISQLLEVGADPKIANAAGLRPSDFGVGEDVEDGMNRDAVDGSSTKVVGSGNMSRESSDDIVTSITHLLNETSNSFQTEVKKKQTDLDSLHAVLRSTSVQLNDARRTLDSLQSTAKSQLLTRQKVFNLTRGREEEQKRLAKIEQTQGPLDETSISWEAKLQSLPELGSHEERRDDGSIPSATVLQARIQALKNRTELTRTGVASLKSRSKDIEIKYRKVVALCTGILEGDVDSVLDGLVRAVESEKGDLEVGRVRRFLGGVETIA
ncbi:putative start control protein cdc10 protein [Rosellinia necatrix]|uniref:Transcription factor SWI6 n=1 Tax=Rosellinia necatrix TaxID=77044 RepID=A0A1W2TFV0_ROSNE|nr:putative start control protein cdc10 protein [Rosellinia necatrix]